MSSGYREFKSSQDPYRNDIAALFFVPLGEVTSADATISQRNGARLMHLANNHHDDDTTEVATFHIGKGWFGIRSAHVLEAIEATEITPMPGMPTFIRGMVLFRNNPIMVVDLRDDLHLDGQQNDGGYRQIVVVKEDGGESFGILVNQLGEIPEIANDRIKPIPSIIPGSDALAEKLVKPIQGSENKEILILLSPEGIRKKLGAYGSSVKKGAPAISKPKTATIP